MTESTTPVTEPAAAPVPLPVGSPSPGTDFTPTWRRAGPLLLLILVVALPLVIALGALHRSTWYPMGDDAQTELRVRDVGTAHPPLTGLGGRIGDFGPDTGSHPGPISFWSMAVFYRLAGSSPFALQLAVGALNVIASGLLVWMARRRGGDAAMVGMAAVLLILSTAYGMRALTTPWNPYLPILWWVVAVVAAWSLLCGDLPMAPIAVFAASFCIQTHVSYLGLGGVVLLVSAVSCGWWLRVRHDDQRQFRAGVGWVAVGAVAGVVLWFPPIAEQITGSQGHNLSIIFDHFRSPPESPVGLRMGASFVLASMNPWSLLTKPVIDGGSFLGGPLGPGLVLVTVWAGAAGAAWRLRHPTLLRLHALLACLVAVGVLSAGRIFGPPFIYLALWGWGICALVVYVVAWSLGALARRWLAAVGPARPRSSLAPFALSVGLVLVVALAVREGADANTTEVFQPELSVRAAGLMPDAVRALATAPVRGAGPDGHYLVTWTDPWYGGAGGFTLFNELDRAGFRVGSTIDLRYAVTRHRVLRPGEATAEVHLATGPDVDVWRRRAGAHLLASYDPAGAAGRAEYRRLKGQVLAELRAVGATDAIATLERDPFGLVNPLVPSKVLSPAGQAQVRRMIELGQPAAVFVAPLPPAR